MFNFRKIPILFVIGAILLSACSLPIGRVSQTEAINTAVAATIEAQLAEEEQVMLEPTMEPATNTAVPQEMPTETSAPTIEATATATVEPSATVEPTAAATQPATATPVPCNAVSFVKDVTIEDGTEIVMGTSFVKTWRLRNVGTCTWNSSYDLVFIDGNAMNGPAAQPLTGGTVAPNQTVDVSVNLKAPDSVGNKTGRWGIRSPEGVIFTLSTGPFWVKIKAVPAEALESTYSASLVASESGAVKSNATLLSYPNIGDDVGNLTYQGFLSFDISAIPSDATILEVKTDFTNYDTLPLNGVPSPFAALGCLRMYIDNYGSLGVDDYVVGSPLGAVARWCNTDELDDVDAQTDLVAAIQERLGHDRAKFRVHFNQTLTNGDGNANMVRFGDGIKLIIKYSH